MERKLYDFFEGEAMPEDCAQKIEAQMTRHPKPMIQWRRFAAAAAVLVLMLAVFNAEAICVKAQEIRDFVVNALSPEAGPVGQVEEDIYISFHGVVSGKDGAQEKAALNRYFGKKEIHFAEVRDGRLFFIANGENIDITDQCSMDTAFIYVVEDNRGYIHYLCVGGTPDNWGEEEYIWNPALGDRFEAWTGSSGYMTCTPENEDARWPWVYDARERCGFPFHF